MMNNPLFEEIHARIPTLLDTVNPGYENTFQCSKNLYEGSYDWRMKWPRLLEKEITGGTLFFTDLTGSIGKGVWTEIEDTRKKGLPVYLITPDKKVHPFDAIAWFSNDNDWKHYKRVQAIKQDDDIEEVLRKPQQEESNSLHLFDEDCYFLVCKVTLHTR
jgi:hypothetical protein